MWLAPSTCNDLSRVMIATQGSPLSLITSSIHWWPVSGSFSVSAPVDDSPTVRPAEMRSADAPLPVSTYHSCGAGGSTARPPAESAPEAAGAARRWECVRSPAIADHRPWFTCRNDCSRAPRFVKSQRAHAAGAVLLQLHLRRAAVADVAGTHDFRLQRLVGPDGDVAGTHDLDLHPRAFQLGQRDVARAHYLDL